MGNELQGGGQGLKSGWGQQIEDLSRIEELQVGTVERNPIVICLEVSDISFFTILSGAIMFH